MSSAPRPAPRQPRVTLADRARRLLAPLLHRLLGTPPPRPAPTLDLPPLEVIAGGVDSMELPALSTVAPANLGDPSTTVASGAVEGGRAPARSTTARSVAAARAARERLVASGRWRPAWDGDGLVEVFGALGEGPALDRLVAALERSSPVVDLGPSPCAGAPMGEGAAFHGTPSAASLERHRRATALVASTPGLSYAEALRRVAP